MKKNLLKSLYTRGKPALGCFMTLVDAGIAVILADSGFDWLFVDIEHNPFGEKDIISIVDIMRTREAAVMLRIRENTQSNVKFALDMGAQGVIVPQLKTVGDFERLVEYGKYPPAGQRGYSPLRVTDFWTDKADYDAGANEETLLIGQIECAQAVEAIEEIVRLEGIDGFFIGPADLSWSMGCRGDSSRPEVQAAIEKVISACTAASKPWGMPVASKEEYTRRVLQGGTIMSYGSDSSFMKKTATQAAGLFKDKL